MAEIDILNAIAASNPPAGTNYCTNPSMEAGAADALATGWMKSGSVTGTPVYSKVAGVRGGLAQRIQYTGVAGDASGDKTLLIYFGAPMAAAPGDIFTFSATMSGALTGVTWFWGLIKQTWGAFPGGSTLTTAPTGIPTRRSTSIISGCDAGTTGIYGVFWINAIGTGDVIDITIDDVLIEKSAVLTPYFDGSFPDCSWTAAANASTSVRLSVSQVIAALKSLVDAVKLKSDTIPASPAAVGSAMTLTSGERTSNASAVRTNLAAELARIDENVSAAKTLTSGERTSISGAVSGLAITGTSDLPLGPWTRHGGIISASQAFENGPYDHGLVAEPSIILNDHEWMAWYTTFGGIGHATATSPYGPWTKLPGLADLVDGDFSPLVLDNGNFETGSGGTDAWMPQWWNLIETVNGTLGGTLKFNHVAGRTGGYALHVEYQATAGDAGKQIILYRQGQDNTVTLGDTVRGSVYVKKTTLTDAEMLIVVGDNLVPAYAGAIAAVVPTTDWAQYEVRGKWFGLGVGPVQIRPFAITLTSDSAVVDILIDDAALSLSSVATNPVESDGQCSSVALVDGVFHMYYITSGSSAAILHRTSADGIIWSVPDTALVAGSASDWDPSVWNTCLWQDEAGVWYLFYDGFTRGTPVVPGGVGYAYSDDPAGPWTKYAGNPVIASTLPGFAATPGFEDVLIEGGPSVATFDGVNYMFVHGHMVGVVGSDTFRCSGGPNVWTLDSAVPILPRLEADEGPPPGTGQLADPLWVTDGTTQYLFASTNTIGGQPEDEKIKLFTAPIVQMNYLGISADLDALIGDLDAVKIKTNTIGSLAVTVTSPVAASGTITLYAGDDYASADARAITVAVPDAGHVLGLTAVGAVVKLKATQATWEAASVASTTDGYTVTFEATAAQTAAVTRAQRYELEATLANGHVVTLAKGSLVTRTNIAAVV